MVPENKKNLSFWTLLFNQYEKVVIIPKHSVRNMDFLFSSITKKVTNSQEVNYSFILLNESWGPKNSVFLVFKLLKTLF